jgi:formate hydrogenlyase subunit 3/multisubunit Na+/H+ antiporter MnhD subunit
MSISEIMIAVSAILFVALVFIFARWFEGLWHRKNASEEVRLWRMSLPSLEMVAPILTVLILIPFLLSQCSQWVEEEKQSQSE